MKLHRRMAVTAFLTLTLFVSAIGCGRGDGEDFRPGAPSVVEPAPSPVSGAGGVAAGSTAVPSTPFPIVAESGSGVAGRDDSPETPPVPTAVTPTPEPQFIRRSEPHTICSRGPHFRWETERTHRWSPDGSRIVFSTRGLWEASPPTIYAVDADGRQLRQIVDASGEITLRGKVLVQLGNMTYFDVSPDGSRLVYSTCGRPTSGESLYEFYDDDIDSGWVLTHVYRDGKEQYNSYRLMELRRHSYDVVVSNIDGTDAMWLTEDKNINNFPVWSPDGSRIAFISRHQGRLYRQSGLYTMWPYGSLVRMVSSSATTESLALPPSWSPDGRRLAFVGDGYEGLFVYTVGADGSDQVRVSETLSLPSWSPDGQRVALVAPEEVGAALYTFAPDGSDPVRVAGIVGLPEERRFGGSEWPGWVGSVSWSPDGSEILVGPTVVRLDGSEPPRALPLLGPIGSRKEAMDGLRTSWSPDGSRIAVQTEQAESRPSRGDGWPLLYTVDRDGTNPRVLVMEVIESDGDRHVTGWDPARPPADVEACSNGEVVPDPEGNSGLVEDCRVLLGMRDTLSGSAVLDWSSDAPIMEWRGVEVDGEPLRVREINIGGGHDKGELYGHIPPEMGSLTGLRTLSIGFTQLNGSIPPELGNLTNLELLTLIQNRLSGGIPPELDNLENLGVMTVTNVRD